MIELAWWVIAMYVFSTLMLCWASFNIGRTVVLKKWIKQMDETTEQLKGLQRLMDA